jgi:hypothetical protein
MFVLIMDVTRISMMRFVMMELIVLIAFAQKMDALLSIMMTDVMMELIAQIIFVLPLDV